MFARVNIFQGSPESLDQSQKIAEERIVPELRALDGSVGIFVLGDRQTGRSIAITLWESEQAMKASEETANRMRSDSSQETGEEVVSVERYEVLQDERWAAR
jgi:heme-degrading monooxygenase HmoA